jgi:hypothetical protein
VINVSGCLRSEMFFCSTRTYQYNKNKIKAHLTLLCKTHFDSDSDSMPACTQKKDGRTDAMPFNDVFFLCEQGIFSPAVYFKFCLDLCAVCHLQCGNENTELRSQRNA